MNDPVAKALRREAFGKLDFLLNQDPSEEPWVIEILTEPILPVGTVSIDGTFVGINKKTIQLAFIEACVIMRARGTAQKRLKLSHKKDVDLASRIIWLHDPEHLTASNCRKRILAERKQIALYEDELKLLACILNSPLHRQSKSPTLWYHRYWCIKQLLALNDQESADEAVTYMQSLITEELGVVREAAEQHPCNYYAWQHARRVLSLLDSKMKASSTIGSLLSHQCIQAVQWCVAHPRDTSAWSFLLFMLNSSDSKDINSTIKHVLDWMRHLQWQGEATWHFLRSMAADVDLELDAQYRESVKLLAEGYFCKDPAIRPSWHSQWELMGAIAYDLECGHTDSSEET